ncbi:SAM-dependent methyltransferase [Emcibacter nanhaiensis]|uniref:Class I SAM-dependent methyltransferase n=1 Tax=Emcibacter nanhaiensis TaxID=1505037 RepID=A0A501PKI3_9PROT|nr:cyclopropane-fatty-acyl-phospholipid synthase family protein [Emcibacter nanhaiensis]TPD60607.1 class I SAM-dependent methyltransferase [Emcibacter nanhaiensis]
MYLLSLLLNKLIRFGTLHVIDATGKKYSFAGSDDMEVTVRFQSNRVAGRLFFQPDIGAAEAYMDGMLTMEDGSTIYDLLYLATKNMEWRKGNKLHHTGKSPLDRFTRFLDQINPVGRSQKNVAHHYDLSSELYELFLDPDRQYSCAYFEHPDDSLEQAQINKKKHIYKKLLLESSHKLLDIGCGWGGLALTMNELSGADVTGITLSEEQLAYASRRAGSNDRVNFHLQDYRLVKEKYDRIVSVGMFEHVGLLQYQTFFDKVHDLLEDDGVALLHTIGRADGPGATDPFTKKYIFPGGYAPALSEIAPCIEKAGLYITDIEVWRLHYAETLRHWREACIANKDKIIGLYDDRFYRMWEFYLAGSECAFRNMGHVVFQIQLAKHPDAVPLTRDYISQSS